MTQVYVVLQCLHTGPASAAVPIAVFRDKAGIEPWINKRMASLTEQPMGFAAALGLTDLTFTIVPVPVIDSSVLIATEMPK